MCGRLIWSVDFHLAKIRRIGCSVVINEIHCAIESDHDFHLCPGGVFSVPPPVSIFQLANHDGTSALPAALLQYPGESVLIREAVMPLKVW
jgi:hypothetical protein